MKYLILLLLFIGCSNPVKPAPKGLCVLVHTRQAPGPMVIDTMVTCDECYKIASYGAYQVSSWKPIDSTMVLPDTLK